MPKDSSATARAVIVKAVPIELSQFMKFGGLTESGGEAKQAVAEGSVLLNGVVETRKSKKLAVGDKVTFGEETIVVSLG